jgi:hypothetical protein
MVQLLETDGFWEEGLMKRTWILVVAVGFLAAAGPASAHGVRDRREDVRDRREDVRDRREDRRDARHVGGLRDRLEDLRDLREDVRDRREDRRDRRH